jgi:hypothetical protein
MTVTAQFQQSLHSLMDTLNQANPFFIRCIKSNGNKIPNEFDDETVQRQLRYTGMLETVRIRQAGFNVRLTYDEFIQLYRILLPKGLLSSQNDVRDFLATLNLDRDNYQLGSSKVFLRESEKHKLDCKLHQQIMASIVTLQRWFRVCLERRRFLRIKSAVITIQSYCRMYLVQRYIKRVSSVLKIQKAWRGYKCRSWTQKLKQGIVMFQAHCRGFALRKMLSEQEAQNKSLRRTVMPVQFRSICNSDSTPKGKDLESDDGGYQEDGDLEASHNRLSLRSTLSLPAHTSPTYFLYHPNNRLEDTKKEGVILDTTLTKRKISKSHKTIDYSELDFVPQRKGSDESLGSQRSLESQQSSDSHSSATIRELTRSKPKHGQWSTQSTRSETDSESFPATHSASPSGKQSSYGSFSSEEVFMGGKLEQDALPPKTQLTRAPPVNQSGKRNLDGLKSLPPVRRPNREISRLGNEEKQDVYYGNDHTPNKLEQILGKPEAPIRSIRKAKRAHVKSLGEEVTDGGNLDKNAILGTIEETKTLHKEDLLQHDLTKPSLTPKRQRHNIGLDLRRRNSDPATKASLVSEHPTGGSPQSKITSQDDFKWQKNTSTFSIAGHVFRKIQRLPKDDLCTFCNEKVDIFLTHVYKCSNCKKLFHTKCIQNKSVLQMPCDQSVPAADSGKAGRRKPRKHSRTPYDYRKEDGKFNLTGTSEFTDRTDQIITGTEELTLMQQFITDKIMKIESDVGEKPSDVDRLFKQALREFKDNLVQIYSAASKHGFEAGCIRYKDLITNFMQAMETVCQREQKENDKDFPVTMGVNAFRGFMNEFMSTRAEEKPNKTKRKKEKKRKVETIKHKGHTFLLTIINIPTACEICNSFFMWPIERGLVCQSCKLTCHKKCYTNASSSCNKESGCQGETRRVFGVPLVSLITENNKIPLVIERLLRTIEMYGSYTEGIYRKSGVSSKIKELKVKMDENPDEVDFEKYQVHVLASVLKSFLREMPEPLLTFECYENFITAANLEDSQDRVTTLYDILKKLPPANYDLMERLVFHLARVALHEEVNRMSAASLAIVFAPCVLRTNKVVPAQDSLQDIGSQTQCIETIIREQLRKVRSTLDDIDTLDTACQAATNRLSSLRSSKVFSPDELLPPNQPQQQTNDEEHLLVDHIQEIQKEKEHLTSTLPTLTHAMSDDDMLSTDGDGSLDDISCIAEQDKVRIPVVRSVSGGDPPPPPLQHKVKRQLSSDVAAVKPVEDCEDPIMV